MAYRIGKCLLSDWLKRKGMTQTQLADLLGVTKQQVNKWAMNKQKMSIETAKNVAHILKLESAELLYEWIPVA